MTDTLRLGFAGTPTFAATILQSLLDARLDVRLVLTQPDRPTGRGRKLTPSPVKVLANRHHLDVRDPPRLKGVSIAEADLDLLIVAAYGLILPEAILTTPRLGCLNVHASLLPRWRGAAPVERAIMAGDAESGVCLMQMDQGLDTGPVYVCAREAIHSGDTGTALEARLAALGAQLLVTSLPEIPRMKPEPQPERGITYAHKIGPEDSLLDWAEGASAITRRIQALTERQPVTLFNPGDAQGSIRVRLLGARLGQRTAPGVPPGVILGVAATGLELACPDGSVVVQRVQLNRGKGRPMTPQAAANGYPDLFALGRTLFVRP